MTPKQVKDVLRVAVAANDVNMAWPAVRQIVDQDMYINVAKPAPTEAGRFIITRWGNRPCKCGCGYIIPIGTRVWWEPNWGVSMPQCVGKE